MVIENMEGFAWLNAKKQEAAESSCTRDQKAEGSEGFVPL